MDAPTLTRSWPAHAAIGAGLIQLALGAGALTATSGGPGIRAAAVVLALLGAAAIGWAAVVLARGRVIVPRTGMAFSLAGIIGCGVLFAMDPERASILAVAAASVLLVIAGGFCAVAVRRGGARDGRTGMVGMLVGAVVIAALVTPALASTEAGRLAPHGGHSNVTPHGH